MAPSSLQKGQKLGSNRLDPNGSVWPQLLGAIDPNGPNDPNAVRVNRKRETLAL
jgi:hypothetical protein